MAAPFSLLYVRPEIATGFYDFPKDRASTEVAVDAPQGDDEPDPAATESPFVSLFPGVPPEEAVNLIPDGQIVRTIRQRLEQRGLLVVQERMVQLTRPQLRRLQLFASREDSDDEAARAAFLDRFTRGPTLVLLLALPSVSESDTAVLTLKKLLGADDPAVARKQAIADGVSSADWPLRALCGLNAHFPGLYGSATLDCAARERRELLPEPRPSLESAVVGLLPSFLATLPDGRTRLLAEFNRQGVVVTSTIERNPLSIEEIASITAAELHESTDASSRETFRSQLETDAAEGMTVLLRVVGFDLDATLREIVGPASFDQALQFFPESLRAQLPNAPLVALEDHVRSRENAVACLETGIFVSQMAKTVQQLVPEDERIDTTFAIIKPNAACDPETVEQIQSVIQSFGFSIDKQRHLRLSRAQAAAFYAEHTGKAFFERLLSFMTRGEIVAMQLSRKLAIPMWRALMGPTNCLMARETHPWTLRARFGLDGNQNATHGSDAPASARRELRFFFGATTLNAPLRGDELSTAKPARVPLALPYKASDSLEKVLVRGLDEMMQQQLSGPLEACRWLGEWLLRQSEQQNQGGGGVDAKPTTSTVRSPKKAVAAPPQLSEAWRLPGDSHKVVVIAVDVSVSSASNERIKQMVQSHVEPLGYAFVDACGSSVDELVRHVKNAGRRRVVLFNWDASCLDAWTQHCGAFSVSTIVSLTATSAAIRQLPMDPFISHVSLTVPPSLDDASCLLQLFREVLDPQIVLLDAPSASDSLCSLAERLGFASLSFEALVAAEIARERDSRGPFSQWRRTHATLPPQLLLEALRRAVVAPESVALPAATHKMLLVGFPWETVDPRELERCVGRVAGVVHVGRTPTMQWGRAFVRRGIVRTVDADHKADEAVAALLAPEVTFVVGGEDASAVRTAAGHCGHVWIDVAALPAAATASADQVVSTLEQLLVRKAASRHHFVLHGFPRSREEALAFFQRIATPRAVIIAASATNPLPLDLQNVLGAEAPHAIQSFIPSSASALRGLMAHKTVAFAVGDCAALDVESLRTAVRDSGVGIIDLRDEKNDGLHATLDLVAACCFPRCLVVSSMVSVDYFQSLAAHFGDALSQIFVFKQRKIQPPPKPRDPDEDYASEEEAELEKQRQHEATTLPPPLSKLVEAFHRDHPKSAKTVPRVQVVSFLKPPEALAHLEASLQPRMVGILGHKYTFYQHAARNVCRVAQLPFVDLSTGDVTALRSVIAASSASTFVVDGFPRDTAVRPYAAQQILQLEQTVARFPLLVRFHASLDVLMERKAPGTSRNALEDAMDEAEDAAKDLVAAFAQANKHVRSLRHVSCERELHDAQDEFTETLQAVVGWSNYICFARL